MANSYIEFPAEHVFPRNPAITQWIDPAIITEQFIIDTDTIESRGGVSLSNKKDSLQFDIGFAGKRNIIKLYNPAYIDYSQYDFTTNVWDVRPISVLINDVDIVYDIDNKYIENVDITSYFKNETVVFAQEATSVNELSFYFDGEKIVTNYDFSNPDDRLKVKVVYAKTLSNIRVKAILSSTSSSITHKTPSIDQYTLVVGKQKLVN